MVSTFLFFISIIFNVVNLFAIVLLYMRQNRLSGLKEEQEKMIRDTEDMISAYLLQMKEENEAFLKKISSIKPKPLHYKENPDIQPKRDDQDAPFSKQPIILKKEALKAYKQQETRNISATGLEKQREISDLLEENLYENVLFLQKKGLTLEEIAHKLNKGTTEIKLLLKFRNNHQ